MKRNENDDDWMDAVMMMEMQTDLERIIGALITGFDLERNKSDVYAKHHMETGQYA